MRNIIGTPPLTSANGERERIDSELATTMREETKQLGIANVRKELKGIDPSPDVQETMNGVVTAENEKVAATDFAPATIADSAQKAAEGVKQAEILEAQGEAQAIHLVNQAADKYFGGNARPIRKLR